MKRTMKLMDSISYTILALGMAGALTLVYGTRGGAKDDCHIPSSGQKFMKVTEVPARRECICREVSEVVKGQADRGLITYERAERIASKCWKIDF